MSENTFNSDQLEALKRFIKKHENVLIKRSRFYNRSIVVGVPDKPGSLLISYTGTDPDSILGIDCDGYWLVHKSETLTPKELADGVYFLHQLDEDRFYHWSELTKFLEYWCLFRK